METSILIQARLECLKIALQYSHSINDLVAKANTLISVVLEPIEPKKSN